MNSRIATAPQAAFHEKAAGAPRAARAALVVLVILQLAMLGALYAGVPPHPPARVAPFAMAPFLSASLSAAAVALVLGPLSRGGRRFALLAAAMALVSYGPQKYADPALVQIWPAVLAGQGAVLVILWQTWACRFRRLHTGGRRGAKRQAREICAGRTTQEEEG